MDTGLEILGNLTTFAKYAKYVPGKNRRENWDEIVDRYEEMMVKKYPKLKESIINSTSFIRDKKVLPSMRALQFSGAAAEVNNARIYNCCYLPIDSLHSFSETMYLLLGGTGVGYSVQKHHTNMLPDIKAPGKKRNYLIEDSIMGWADAVKVLMKAYLEGSFLPSFDFRAIREKGARLVTAGGKAPGPEPLRVCLAHVQEILDRKIVGEKLTPLECHDILCFIANSVLSGGIRRSAMISLFDHDDEEMISCKAPSKVSIELIESHKEHVTVKISKGLREVYTSLDMYSWESYLESGTIGWWVLDEQRGRSNNSAVLERGKITEKQFKDLWKRIEESGSGEPGSYWTNNRDWGTNPCCEIALRPYQFCNLCEVNVSDVISQEDLCERVGVAAFFGTLQAGFTDFHYLRPIWAQTTQKDALLGIGMTGIGSGEILKYDLTMAAKVAVTVNQDISALLGINEAARVTCIKPAGTTSLALGVSSGIHAWHNDFYLRTMRFTKNEAIAMYLMDNHPELCEDDILRPNDTVCVRIPVKAPEGAIMRTETAIDTLERVKKFSKEWIKPGHVNGDNTHNVSATISIDKSRLYVKDSHLFDTKETENKLHFVTKEEEEKYGVASMDEWEASVSWMWENREDYNGLSVLDYNGGSYVQAPFEDITEEEYIKRISSLKYVNFDNVVEMDDNVEFGQTAACAGGACEINI